jgi:hypothetical protein
MQRLTPRNPYNPIDGGDDNSCIIYFYLFLDAIPKKKFPEAIDEMGGGTLLLRFDAQEKRD